MPYPAPTGFISNDVRSERYIIYPISKTEEGSTAYMYDDRLPRGFSMPRRKS